MATSASLRRLSRFFVVATLGLLGLLALAGSASAAAPAAEQRILDAMNRERAGAGLGQLVMDGQAVGVARGWADHMAATNQLAHNPNYAAQIAGERRRVGENVGFTSRTGASEAELADRVHAAFMASAGHRANILGDYNAVGVGVTVTPAGKLWVTVNFILRSTPPAPPAPAPAPAPAPPASIEGQVAEAVRVSKDVFGDDAAQFVVLTRGDVFADALSGSGLAGGEAPILFTGGSSLHGATRTEIDRVLRPGGTVYLLGGTGALSPEIESALTGAGYRVVRLAGSSRIETSVRVAQEVVARHGRPAEVLLARADDWADAVTGGAYATHAQVPVLLTPREQLAPAVAGFLNSVDGERAVALGGRAALADQVVQAAGARRVAGADRAATAVAVAEQLWGRTTVRSGDNFLGVPGYAADGWAYALAQTAWAARNAAPQLLVGDQVASSVATYLQRSHANLRCASGVPTAVSDHLRQLMAS